ncbi:ABC transporter ATP-binding protein [Rhizorhapis sp.]|uniref:ABC transporter ATP-binding protein n=1 Tax=Rhizorhapis sp. TaxID=1968842 RepID=UPI002B46A089|nr:ABC transporter ATP-binding protein [Rhizorhapis sp.]HKR17978.1 ABC transporter ATP-binding protein [Rhizorhapis sp.]
MDMQFSALSLSLRGRQILNDVTGRLEQGRVTVILGANGAGKSTLLSCLAGLRRPDSGTVGVGERDIHSLDRRERARTIGLLPQQGDIHWDIDVATLVGLGRMPHRGRWGMSEADHRAVASAMAATDCAHLAQRQVLRLSGGEQGRVLLARVLAGEPQWLLADEPLASLDPAHQLDVLDRLKQCAKGGAGVAVVLHDLTHAARIADDILVLKDGAIIAAGPRDEVLSPATLAQAYGVEVHIATGPTGDPMLVPIRRIA